MSNRLIALYSPAMGHGKGEVTKVLVEQFGYTVVKLAGTLKDMLRVFLRDFGASPEQIERAVEGDLKEKQVPGLPPNVTTRFLMQTLGTDWGRAFVHPEVWTKIATGRITRLLETGKPVVVDDMRFPNEYDCLFELGAVMVKVERPGVRPTNGHRSEGLLDDKFWKAQVVNDSTLEALQEKAKELIRS